MIQCQLCTSSSSMYPWMPYKLVQLLQLAVQSIKLLLIYLWVILSICIMFLFTFLKQLVIVLSISRVIWLCTELHTQFLSLYRIPYDVRPLITRYMSLTMYVCLCACVCMYLCIFLCMHILLGSFSQNCSH